MIDTNTHAPVDFRDRVLGLVTGALIVGCMVAIPCFPETLVTAPLFVGLTWILVHRRLTRRRLQDIAAMNADFEYFLEKRVEEETAKRLAENAGRLGSMTLDQIAALNTGSLMSEEPARLGSLTISLDQLVKLAAANVPAPGAAGERPSPTSPDRDGNTK
ncbi:hypothetical protein ACRAWC_01720 [Leifsonia sp. L25]|uniref:hypothetical protein n=1 Tax=Actinomycetes TaxID=1760 RepID=UPI003D699C94